MKAIMKPKLLALLRRQWTTPMDALRHCQCMSLAQRVSEWRSLHRIIDKWVKLPSGKRVKAYKIVL